MCWYGVIADINSSTEEKRNLCHHPQAAALGASHSHYCSPPHWNTSSARIVLGFVLCVLLLLS
jgi:hypothetical protein